MQQSVWHPTQRSCYFPKMNLYWIQGKVAVSFHEKCAEEELQFIWAQAHCPDTHPQLHFKTEFILIRMQGSHSSLMSLKVWAKTSASKGYWKQKEILMNHWKCLSLCILCENRNESFFILIFDIFFYLAFARRLHSAASLQVWWSHAAWETQVDWCR